MNWTDELMNWTDELIDERNRRQAARGFVGALAQIAGRPELATERAVDGMVAQFEKIEKKGRVKGIAAAADRTCNGRVYHSKAEAKKALELYLAQKAGAFRRVTPQVPYPIVVNGVKICKVLVDFEIEENDGSISTIEVKGFETEVYKLKAKLLRACYPALKYNVVKV